MSVIGLAKEWIVLNCINDEQKFFGSCRAEKMKREAKEFAKSSSIHFVQLSSLVLPGSKDKILQAALICFGQLPKSTDLTDKSTYPAIEAKSPRPLIF